MPWAPQGRVHPLQKPPDLSCLLADLCPQAVSPGLASQGPLSRSPRNLAGWGEGGPRGDAGRTHRRTEGFAVSPPHTPVEVGGGPGPSSNCDRATAGNTFNRALGRSRVLLTSCRVVLGLLQPEQSDGQSRRSEIPMGFSG